jgi:hypothetical protein
MKVSILVLLFSACCLISSAQVSFGVKAGLNLNYVLFEYEDSDLNSSVESSLGFHFGGYMQVPIGKRFSFQPELQISKRGALGGIDLYYHELPILISYAPWKAFQFELGGNVSVMGASKKSPLSDYQNTFEFGITGGVRYSLSTKIFVSARYYYGLTPAQSVNLYNLYRPLDPNDPLLNQSATWMEYAYNRTIQFSLGYKIK